MMKSALNIWCILSICVKSMQFIVALHTKCDLAGKYNTGKSFMKSTFPNQRVLLCSMPPVLLFYGIFLNFVFVLKVNLC